MRVGRSVRLTTHVRWSAVLCLCFLGTFVRGSEMDLRRLSFPKTRMRLEATTRIYPPTQADDSNEHPVCSSLSGPSCDSVALEEDDDEYEYDSSDVMAKVKLLSDERQRAHAKKERDAFALHRKNAVEVEKERLTRVRRARERERALWDEKEDVPEPRREETTKDQRPKSVSPGEHLASVHRAAKQAASEVECEVCRSISREALAFAATPTPSGRAMPEANILNFVHEMCLGDVPRLLHYYSVLPRPPPDGGDVDGEGRRRSFAFGERDGKGSLFTFEQRAFSMACAKVVDEIDIELSERAFAAVKATTDASLSGDRFSTRARVEAETCASFCEAESSSLGRLEAPESDALLRNGCIYSAKGYWAMEVCFERSVRQFHVVDWPKIDQVVSLGTFEAQGVGGEQYFAGGDFCAGVRDESKNRPTGPGRARRSVVRWVCSPDGKERISSSEPRTCEYDITVFTPALC